MTLEEHWLRRDLSENLDILYNWWLKTPTQDWLVKDVTFRDIKEEVLGTYTIPEQIIGSIKWVAIIAGAVAIIYLWKK